MSSIAKGKILLLDAALVFLQRNYYDPTAEFDGQLTAIHFFVIKRSIFM